MFGACLKLVKVNNETSEVMDVYRAKYDKGGTLGKEESAILD